MFFLKGLLVAVGSILLVASGCPKGKLAVVSPEKGVCWYEGRTYTIRWKGGGPGKVCISVLLGGKDKGIVNDCSTKASRGSYEWSIPQGFVTGFGVAQDDRARVCIFYEGSPSHYVCSPYFTIAGSQGE